jgi:hypothetical protein
MPDIPREMVVGIRVLIKKRLGVMQPARRENSISRGGRFVLRLFLHGTQIEQCSASNSDQSPTAENPPDENAIFAPRGQRRSVTQIEACVTVCV